MFPLPTTVETRPCRRCDRPVMASRLIRGYGSDCAERLGLTGAAVESEQSGPDLLDLLGVVHEPDDVCDGWDRPADRP